MPIKMPSSEQNVSRAQVGARKLVVLEGMPGAGKTTTARALARQGRCVVGEYTTADGRTVPLHAHPEVNDDQAHQTNWLTKASHATHLANNGGAVFCDRDWLSALAYAYAIADTEPGRLLTARLTWAERHLQDGTLVIPDVYVVFHVGVSVSLRRRASDLRPDHPWSKPGPLRRLRAFYQDPPRLLADLHPPLKSHMASVQWRYVSGLSQPEHNIRLVCESTEYP